jgi:hypothetical protein
MAATARRQSFPLALAHLSGFLYGTLSRSRRSPKVLGYRKTGCLRRTDNKLSVPLLHGGLAQALNTRSASRARWCPASPKRISEALLRL